MRLALRTGPKPSLARALFFTSALLVGITGSALADTLSPLPSVTAPALTEKVQARFETDAGNFTVEVYPQAAPNAARRFLELIRIGFFNNTPVFRVVPGFVVQFGINGRDGYGVWENKNFDDDPSLFKLDRGTLAFAKSGPNTNRSQVFMSCADYSRLSKNGGFSSFAKVVDGMATVDSFRSVGDPRMGLDQDELWKNGESYLKRLPEKPAMILKAVILPSGETKQSNPK